jgi:hypothetical protein
MAATLVPIRGKQIKPLGIGEKCTYRFTLTDIPGPDPATWSTIRFSICDNDRAAYFTVPKTDMTVTPSGTPGDYEAIIDVPVTEENSLAVEPNPDSGLRLFSLDFASPTAKGVLVDGTVPVFEPYVAL